MLFPFTLSPIALRSRLLTSKTKSFSTFVAEQDASHRWENVAVVPGGRAGLIRIAAVLNNAYLGFFIPDYTAYNVSGTYDGRDARH